MPTDASRPEFLIDRSLGRNAVPKALREAGIVVHTLADLYGEAEAQKVEDTDRLADAGRRRWAVLSKDDRIRRRPAELEALRQGRVRAFFVTSAQLPRVALVARIPGNLDANPPTLPRARTLHLRTS